MRPTPPRAPARGRFALRSPKSLRTEGRKSPLVTIPSRRVVDEVSKARRGSGRARFRQRGVPTEHRCKERPGPAEHRRGGRRRPKVDDPASSLPRRQMTCDWKRGDALKLVRAIRGHARRGSKSAPRLSEAGEIAQVDDDDVHLEPSERGRDLEKSAPATASASFS